MPISLVLILLALTAADPAAATRVPGTRFSLGMSEEQIPQGAEFSAARASGAGATMRQGATKFFGVAGEAKLFFRNGRLDRVQFEAQDVSPQAMDYVEDQMRRSKLWRECTRLEPANRSCDWLGTVRIHLEIEKSRMHALVTPRTSPEEEPPAGLTAESGESPAQETLAATPAVATPATSHDAAPGSAAAQPPAKAAEQPEIAPAIAKPVAAPATAAKTPAPTPQIPATADAVPVLPETLRISLPERNPPSVWPRMTSVPVLEYPESAKAAGVQGIVWLMTLVNPDGSVRTARVERGIPALNEAALAWIARARFAPCDRDGQPCRFWVRVAARFIPS